MSIIFQSDLLIAKEVIIAVSEYLKTNNINKDFQATNFIKDGLHGFSLLFIGELSFDRREVFFSQKGNLIIVYYAIGKQETNYKLFENVEGSAKFIVEFLVNGKVK